MESLLEAIRVSVASDATDELRAAGAAACRTILTALEAKPGESLTTTPATSTPTPIASAVAALRNVPPDQLLDLAIARLRAALPPEVSPPPVQPLKFHVVTLPRVLPAKSR